MKMSRGGGFVNVRNNFKGHESAVISLSFDHKVTKLASGSVDNNIIVWSIEENRAFRFKGHQVFFFLIIVFIFFRSLLLLLGLPLMINYYYQHLWMVH
jgi:WD40 repeat protein